MSFSLAPNLGFGERMDFMDQMDVAQFEESALADSAASLALEHIAVAGGVAAFAESGSWLNQAWGLGIGGEVTPAEIDRLVAFYTERQREPMVTAATIADRSLITGLAEHGFVVRQFIEVFVRPVESDVAGLSTPTRPAGLEIQVVDPDDRLATELWVQTSASGFHDGATPPDAMVQTSRRVIADHENIGLVATVDGVPAAAGIVAITQGHSGITGAGFSGTSVLPPFRGRGVQQHLIRERLRIAAEHDAQIATIASVPGVATGRNALRAGFILSYVKAIFVIPS